MTKNPNRGIILNSQCEPKVLYGTQAWQSQEFLRSAQDKASSVIPFRNDFFEERGIG
jgi:hypothetical protein